MKNKEQIINMEEILTTLLPLLLSILLALFIILNNSGMFRIILGLPFILFFPGYTLILALFPSRNDLDGIERVALSIGLSIAVVPLVGLILNYSPWGIGLYSILLTMLSFIAIMSMVAIYVRKFIPIEERFIISIKYLDLKWKELSKLNKGILVFLPTLITFIIFLAAVFMPYYLQFAGPYSNSSVINGINILEHGHIIDYSKMKLAHGQLAWDLKAEESYPLPSLLSAIILAITGLPYEKVAYIPVAGFGVLLYYVLAKYVLSNKNNGYALLLAVAYFGFIVSNRLGSLTTGRAILGTTVVLPLFIFSFLQLLTSSRGKIFSWLFICLITAAMAGGTYYSATLTIISIIFVSFIAPLNRFQFINSNISLPRGFSVFILAMLLFLMPPLLATVAPNINLQVLLSHILDAVNARLGMESNEASQLQGAYLASNLANQIRLWGLRVIILLSFFSIAYIILAGIRNPEKRITRQWLCAFIAIGVFLSEIPYMFKTFTIPTRSLVFFGFLCALSIIIHSKKRKIFIPLIIALVTMISFSITSLAFQHGGSQVAKPYAVKKVQPVADYICRNISPGTIAADAEYASTIWLLFAKEKKNSENTVLPLWKDAILLKEAQDGSTVPLVDTLRKRKIKYLLLNFDGTPFFGDTWGYSINLHRGEWLESLPLESVYDDGQFVLYRVR